jgi:DNA topoisomerase-3
MVAGETSPPKPLSEASLISLMNKNGIGTDYTSPEQIKNI